ncbi:MAG: hypothetical protein WCA39_00695 [Nitrososphaeraceae archaeon]
MKHPTSHTITVTSTVEANSPYSQIENKMLEAVKQVIENTILPSDVAKAILEAVTSDTPDFRYVVGKDGGKKKCQKPDCC